MKGKVFAVVQNILMNQTLSLESNNNQGNTMTNSKNVEQSNLK